LLIHDDFLIVSFSGKDWYAGFLRRHPDISLRRPNPVGGRRAEVSFDMIQDWFWTFQEYLTTTGQISLLKSPEITVLGCMNASGLYVPPLIVYSGQRLRSIDVADFPEARL
jgi:hypothetical protein